ncbi:transcription factor domain-containing protein [Aspergillus melleus]|uniref:transcription factor domain-containing protein n=1 Tax=Aspergillus melleus TaxID=138277 RepID=UPI001E8E2EB6|nr:Transcriptional activator [Aspergillus melleus]KAH8435125.1 Transcriptional activator [Aspergillus melleus]
MPPFEFAKRLFWVQYTYIGTIFSLIHPADFEERLKTVYDQPPDFSSRESCLVYCQVLLVIAFGLMYSVNQWSGDDGPPGFKYFKHALRFLPDIHEEGSIFFVEVLCYVAYYMQNLNRRDAAFLYVFTKRSPTPQLVKVIETAGDEHGGLYIVWIVLTYYTQLSRILGRIGEGEDSQILYSGKSLLTIVLEIYRKKPRSGSNLLASAQSITNDLSEWLQRIPDRLRIDFSSLNSHVNRESVSIFLHFYSCVNMTARPLVFYVIQRRLDAGDQSSATSDWKEGLSPNTVAVIDSCISAARATTVIMDAAAKQNLVATYGYLDGEYVFSAALLLVMVNAAFPHNEANARSMGVALSLLRGMADRGNAYLASRHSLLIELQSAIGPNHTRRDDLAVGTPITPSSIPQASPATNVVADQTPVVSTEWPSQQDLPSMRDISFNFDINDDPGLWEEVLDQIDIDMDTDWIENTLKK